MKFSLFCALVALVFLVGCGGSSSTPGFGSVSMAEDELPVPAPAEAWIEAEFISASVTKTFFAEELGSSDQAKFVFKYAITAFGGDVYVDDACAQEEWVWDDRTNLYTVTDPDGVQTYCMLFSTADFDGDAERFRIEENETEFFTLVVGVTVNFDRFVQVALTRVAWLPATALVGDQQDVVDLEGWETDPIFLNYVEGINQCNDGVDNDADGLVDAADPDCDGPDRNSETDYVVPTPGGKG